MNHIYGTNRIFFPREYILWHKETDSVLADNTESAPSCNNPMLAHVEDILSILNENSVVKNKSAYINNKTSYHTVNGINIESNSPIIYTNPLLTNDIVSVGYYIVNKFNMSDERKKKLVIKLYFNRNGFYTIFISFENVMFGGVSVSEILNGYYDYELRLLILYHKRKTKRNYIKYNRYFEFKRVFPIVDNKININREYYPIEIYKKTTLIDNKYLAFSYLTAAKKDIIFYDFYFNKMAKIPLNKLTPLQLYNINGYFCHKDNPMFSPIHYANNLYVYYKVDNTISL